MHKMEKEAKQTVMISKPIIYGNISFCRGKKVDVHSIYLWTCYVRGQNFEDLSYFISKVVFTLHPSFPNHIRTITQSPFEVQQKGWGEFEIGIKIFFKDEAEKPVELFHQLKLHTTSNTQQSSQKKPLVSEFYDEIVFINPSEQFLSCLNENPISTKTSQQKDQQSQISQEESKGPLSGQDDKSSETYQLSDYYQCLNNQQQWGNLATANKQQLQDALDYINSEIKELYNRINNTDNDISKLQMTSDTNNINNYNNHNNQLNNNFNNNNMNYLQQQGIGTASSQKQIYQ